MMEKEIKAYGDRKDTIIRFLKTDDAKLGKVYVLYPNEYEEMESRIADLELELAIQKSKNDDLKEELLSKTYNSDYTEILDKLSSIEQRLDTLESKIMKWYFSYFFSSYTNIFHNLYCFNDYFFDTCDHNYNNYDTHFYIIVPYINYLFLLVSNVGKWANTWASNYSCNYKINIMGDNGYLGFKICFLDNLDI